MFWLNDFFFFYKAVTKKRILRRYYVHMIGWICLIESTLYAISVLFLLVRHYIYVAKNVQLIIVIQYDQYPKSNDIYVALLSHITYILV